jgi:hypothetical protein
MEMPELAGWYYSALELPIPSDLSAQTVHLPSTEMPMCENLNRMDLVNLPSRTRKQPPY